MHFQNSGLRKTLLKKCLKSSVSEDPWTDNITNGLKHCCNLNDSSFTIFMNECQGNCVGKSLFFSDIQKRKAVC